MMAKTPQWLWSHTLKVKSFDLLLLQSADRKEIYLTPDRRSVLRCVLSIQIVPSSSISCSTWECEALTDTRAPWLCNLSLSKPSDQVVNSLSPPSQRPQMWRKWKLASEKSLRWAPASVIDQSNSAAFHEPSFSLPSGLARFFFSYPSSSAPVIVHNHQLFSLSNLWFLSNYKPRSCGVPDFIFQPNSCPRSRFISMRQGRDRGSEVWCGWRLG